MHRITQRKYHNHPHHKAKAGYGVSKESASAVKEFNKDAIVVQGFKATLNASGTIPISIALNAPGKRLLGISMIPGTGTNADIGNSQVTLIVNNTNILLNVAALELNPGFLHCNAFFLPTPQPLGGQDTITVNVLNNNATTPVVYVNIFYVPQ